MIKTILEALILEKFISKALGLIGGGGQLFAKEGMGSAGKGGNTGRSLCVNAQGAGALKPQQGADWERANLGGLPKAGYAIGGRDISGNHRRDRENRRVFPRPTQPPQDLILRHKAISRSERCV